MGVDGTAALRLMLSDEHRNIYEGNDENSRNWTHAQCPRCEYY